MRGEVIFKMHDANLETTSVRSTVLLQSEIDSLLTAQIVVAWAGEGGEEKRMGWWRSDLISEFGGEDLIFRDWRRSTPGPEFHNVGATRRLSNFS